MSDAFCSSAFCPLNLVISISLLFPVLRSPCFSFTINSGVGNPWTRVEVRTICSLLWKMSTPILDGSSLAGTSIQELSAAIHTNRNCVIQITNHSTEALTDPNTFSHSGYCYAPPQPIVEGCTRDACSFSKAADTATGAVGVLTYRLGNSDKRLAIMFSVPYDFNLYSSWFGLAFIEDARSANEELYKEMYYAAESADLPDRKRAKAKDGITLHVGSGGWRISATMSEAKKAIMHVEVTEEGRAGHPHGYPPAHHPHAVPQYGGWSS